MFKNIYIIIMDIPEIIYYASRAEYFKNNPEKAKEAYKRKYENKKRNKAEYYKLNPNENQQRDDKMRREEKRQICECGSSYTQKSKHMKTKKHIKYIESLL